MSEHISEVELVSKDLGSLHRGGLEGTSVQACKQLANLREAWHRRVDHQGD